MGEIYEGKHEPLITKDLFDRTQEAFRKDNKPKHMIAKNFLFAGMVKCSKCGAIFQVKLKRVNIELNPKN